VCAISSLTSTFAILSPDEFLSLHDAVKMSQSLIPATGHSPETITLFYFFPIQRAEYEESLGLHQIHWLDCLHWMQYDESVPDYTSFMSALSSF